VGRLVSHKHVEVLIQAMAQTPGVCLEIVGDGPDRQKLLDLTRSLSVTQRVGFSGSQPRRSVVQRLSEADVLLLASSYEGLPHVAIEALGCSTPVVAPSVGGLQEAIVDQGNGLILAKGAVGDFVQALTLLRDDRDLLRRLSEQALRDSDQWRFEVCADRLEMLLQRVCAKNPQVVFFGKGSLPWPVPEDLNLKVKILADHLSPTFVTTGRAGIGRARGARVVSFSSGLPAPAASCAFYGLGALVSIAFSVGPERKVISCQSPFEGFCVAVLRVLTPKPIRPRLLVEVHGDWRTSSRLYGSKARRLLSPVADWAAGWALRRADRVRVVSSPLARQVRQAGFQGPLDQFVAYSDFESFEKYPVVPLPENPHVAFVGVFEDYKGIDVLLEGLKVVAARFPECWFSLAGVGSRLQWARQFVSEAGLDSRVNFLGHISRAEVLALLDRSSLLVLPSRSEGLPRVIMEAFARGRAVVAARVGGVADLLDDHKTGILIDPEDSSALAAAVAELLNDSRTLAAMGKHARSAFLVQNPLAEFERWVSTLSAWAREK